MKDKTGEGILMLIKVISRPLIPMITGFGMFSFYAILHWPPLFCLMVALYTAALMGMIEGSSLLKELQKDKKRTT